MARIIFSALVESIRGSIAGTTFQRNKYGYSAKKKPRITKPNTPYQNRQKRYLSAATKSWRERTEAIRTSWETWAATYPSYARNNPSAILSGYAVYVKQSVYNLMFSGAVYEFSPNFTLQPDDTVDFSLQLNAGALELVASSALDSEAWRWLIFVSRPLSSAQLFVGTKPRLLPFFIENFSGTYDITSEYISLFGVLPQENERVAVEWIEFVQINGQAKARQTTIETVTDVTP